MERDVPSINHRALPLGVARVEDQKNAFLTLEDELPPRNGEYLLQPEHVMIKLLGLFQIVDVKGGLKYAAEFWNFAVLMVGVRSS